MAAVNDYLKKLLYQYDCVVVPELGAFLTHYQPAAFTETSGLYLPPRKRVAFNEALRFDDGILANYIMLHEPVTREDAQKFISTFVSRLRQQIQTIGRFEIEGVGTFTHNDEGRLQFDPSLRHNFFGESFGMSAVLVQLVNYQPQLEPALNAVPVTALGPVLVRDEDSTLTPYRPARPYWRVAAIAMLVGSLGVVSYFSVINPGQPLQSSLDPTNLLRVSASFFERLTNVNVTKAAQPVVTPKVIPAPIAETKSVTALPAEPVIITPTEVIAKPEVVPAEVNVKPEVVSAPKVVVIEKVTSPVAVTRQIRTAPQYTVIAGVFLSKRNALKLKRQLRKAGYDDAFVIMPGVSQKELYKVAAAGSSVRDEAVATMAAINELAGTESWIYKN